MKKSLLFFVILFFVGMPAYPYGEISVQNSNYFNSFTLFDVPGASFDLELHLNYNSRSTQKGIFSYGWGSNLQNDLTIEPSGNLRLAEFGGYKHDFIRKNWSKEETYTFVEKILKAIQKTNPSLSPDLKNKLMVDAKLREKMAKDYGIITKEEDILPGTEYTSLNGGKLTRTNSGWSRIRPDNVIESYDSQGRLLQRKTRTGNALLFRYDARGRLISVIDEANRTIRLAYNEKGLAKEVVSPNTRFVFTYDAKDNLNQMKEIIPGNQSAGRVFSFAYDEYHNMTQVKYPDGSEERMRYEKDKDWILAHELKDIPSGGEVKTAYKQGNTDDKTHYWVSVIKTVKTTGGKERTIADKYEYFHATTPIGTSYLRQSIVIKDGKTVETHYTASGNPLSIKENGKETKFEYYAASGLLSKKTTSDKEATELFYEPNTEKLSRVVHYMPRKEDKTYDYETTDFSWDKNGQLLSATNRYGKSKEFKLPKNEKGELLFDKQHAIHTETKQVELAYDQQGRIRMIKDKETSTALKFQYNEFGRPTQISLPGTGTVYVEYDKYGNVSGLKGPQDLAQGREVASSIIVTFQNLIEIIRPAGVDLSFS